jgi:endonuclease-3
MTSLREIVAALEAHHGRPAPPPTTDPFALVVYETAAYLVPDDRRQAIFERLRKWGRMTPAAIADCDEDALVAAIADGGMHPRERAAKLKEAAAIALDLAEELAAAARRPLAEAIRILKRFPGLGQPGAEKVLLLCGAHPVLALDSNGLRVLLRLGRGEPKRSYAATYRSVRESVDSEVPDDTGWVARAHLVLRHHGQEVCKATRPRCRQCPLATRCQFVQGAVACAGV